MTSEKKLTESQKALINSLIEIIKPGEWICTKQIAEARGDYTTYHSYLRDRLFLLEAAGYLESRETIKNRTVTRRDWTWTINGWDSI